MAGCDVVFVDTTDASRYALDNIAMRKALMPNNFDATQI
jgi:hypothetical protein